MREFFSLHGFLKTPKVEEGRIQMNRLVAAIPILVTAGSAISEISGDWEYDYWSDSTAWLTHYNGSDESVVVPATFSREEQYCVGNDENGQPIWGWRTKTYSVTNIREAFRGNTIVSDISLPSSISTIGALCFFGCTNLSSVSIPGSIDGIGGSAFKNCSALESFSASGNLFEIGGSAFSGCPALASVMIFGDVHFIGSYAFEKCHGNIVISGDVINIGQGAFFGCDGLVSTAIGPNTQAVGPFAFQECTNLTSVVVPGGVKTIGDNAFAKCYNLSSVVLENGIEQIGERVFSDCRGLTTIPIPESVTNIGLFAFSGSGITSITIPNGVTNISWGAFLLCSGLTEVKLPSSLGTLDSYCFEYCRALTNITIPKSVSAIDSSAFRYDSALRDVLFEGSPPAVGSNAFSDIASGARGHYPRSLASEWIPQIDSNGKWNGLIMEELSQPVLRVKEARPAEGTITLAWDDGGNAPEGTTYAVYRSAADTWTDADRVASGLAATEWTDENYWRAEPVLSPLHYWVVAENDHFDIPASNSVEMRHRYGLFIGLADYDPNKYPVADLKRIQSCVDDAEYFHDLFVRNGGCPGSNARIQVSAGDTKLQDIRNGFRWLTDATTNGDFAVIHIDTHGSAESGLLAYDDEYTAQMLAEDLARFSSGVSVFCVIDACHSEALFDGQESQAWLDSYLMACPVNVAFLAAASHDEVSLGNWDTQEDGKVLSELASFLLRFGWNGGFSDANEDGYASISELTQYAERMVHGISDKIKPSHAVPQVPTGLETIPLGTAGDGIWEGRISNPQGLTAIPASRTDDRGIRKGIELSWNVCEHAYAYHIYRAWHPVGNASSPPPLSEFECVRYWWNGTTFFDDRLTATGDRNIYYVVSATPSETSGASNFAVAPEREDMFIQNEIATGKLLPDASLADMKAAGEFIAANGMRMRDCFISGLSPTNASARFLAEISIDATGTADVTWLPDLGTNRVYTVEGKASLSDTNEVWHAPDENSRFFRVRVALPE